MTPSDIDPIKLVSTVESDKEYAPRPAVRKRKAPVRVPPPVEVKAAKYKEVPMPTKKVVAPKIAIKGRRLNGNNVRMWDLPEFTVERWRDTFLPTLYDNFFASHQPFDGFCLGSDNFIALLQAIVEEVYPDIDYKVTSSESIHFLVRHCTESHTCNLYSIFSYLGI